MDGDDADPIDGDDADPIDGDDAEGMGRRNALRILEAMGVTALAGCLGGGDGETPTDPPTEQPTAPPTEPPGTTSSPTATPTRTPTGTPPAPEEDDEQINVLFLGRSETGSHDPVARLPQVAEYLKERGINVVYTERKDDLLVHSLHEYDAWVLFGNRSELSQAQEISLLNFVESGGGFVALHSASGCFTGSDAFIEHLGGQFESHGYGEMTTTWERPDHPVFTGMDGPIEVADETYRHQNLNPENEVLAYGDFPDYGPNEDPEPWTWVREEGDGRVFYTAWGHGPQPWAEPGFKKLVENAIRWTSGNEDTISAEDTRRLPLLQFESLETEDGFVPGYSTDNVPNGTNGFPEEVSSGSQWSRIQHAQSAAESTARTITPPGFELDPFLTEEMLPDGVGGNILDVEFDPQGRAWVALTRDYPNELGEGRDSIVVCDDTDGDGQADEFTVFEDGLSIPLNMVLTDEGAIVVNLGAFDDDGSVLHLKDTNGDGQADEREELFSGFNTGDTHAGPNQLEWGIDNWVWGQVGYTGFSGTINGESYNFSSAVFRFRPDGSEFEVVASLPGNQAGLGFNEEGLAFASVATNQQPSNYVAIPRRFYEAVRGWSAPTLGPISNTNRIMPVTDRVRQGDNVGGYTAASGHEIYTARAYPERYWNRTGFVSEPTGHLVGTWLLEQDGAGYTAEHPRNVAASSDSWFSPIYQKVGPDGMLWVIDWYNYVILHNTGIPGLNMGPGNAYENPLRDAMRSRLYRITHGEADVIDPQPMDLSGASPGELVDALTNDNMFWRGVAQRRLIARADPAEVVPDLIELIEDESVDDLDLNPGAIHALWTLEGLGALAGESADPDAVGAARAALDHPSPGVRLNALRALPNTAPTRSEILDRGLLADDDARVRMWALLVLADVPASEAAGEAIADMIGELENATDDLIVDAATAAGAQHAESFVAAYEANYDVGDDDSDAPNLLENPSFEAGDSLEGWATNTWTGSGEYAVTTEAAHSGDRSVRISSESGIDGSVWQQGVSVEPNTTYTYSAWIKTEDLDPGDSYGAVINPQALGQSAATSPLSGGTSDWQQLEVTFDSGDNGELTFNVTLGGWGQATGTVWFDDVELVESPSGGQQGSVVYERVQTHLGQSDDGSDDPADAGPLDPGTTIRLEGLTAGWEGTAPAAVEGETNPTLTFIAGEEYTVELTNGDGAAHDFVLQDGEEASVESTDVVSGEGETWSLTFTATAEMARYVCTIHPTSMVGSVEVVEE